MGDWYMESGERSYHSGEFGYDKDNDAWVPLGDTPGTTPVWWHSSHDSYDGSREPTSEEIAERESRQREADKWSDYLERTERAISEKREHAEKLDSTMKGAKYFAITVGAVDLVILALAAIVNVSLLAYPWLWFDLAIYGTFIGGIIYLVIRAGFEVASSSEKKKADAMEKEFENQKKQHRKQLFRGR